MLEKSCDDDLTVCCGGGVRNADEDVVHCNSIPTIRYEFIIMVFNLLLSSNWREKEGGLLAMMSSDVCTYESRE